MLCRDQAFAVLLEEKKNKNSSNILGKMRSEDEMILVLVCIMVSCAVMLALFALSPPGLLSVFYYCCTDSSLQVLSSVWILLRWTSSHRISDYGFCFLFFVEMSDGADPDDGAISVTDTIE